MKKNMGSADRVIRTLIALALGTLIFAHAVHGVLAIILGVVAVVFLLTSLMGHCPGYLPIGLSTRKEPPGPPAS
jgi:hypothetical protein